MLRLVPILLLLPLPGNVLAAAEIPVTDPARLVLTNAQTGVTTHRGHKALSILQKEQPGDAWAMLKDVDFSDGEIELEVSGSPSKSADAAARGFIGVMFRFQPDGRHYECIYLRPTNARADNQLNRNHSTQYVSAPDWPWQRLRQETPGQYESYTDMQAGEWTRMRIVVRGKRAELYVNGAAQPCLIVTDLKAGQSKGGVALWIGPGTEGYFRNVRVTP